MFESLSSPQEHGKDTPVDEARVEHSPNYVDVADIRVQQGLIEYFFLSRYPGMMLSDPDARKFAVEEWAGDADDPTTYAARFRDYVQNSKGAEREININDSATFAHILEDIGAGKSDVSPARKRALQ